MSTRWKFSWADIKKSLQEWSRVKNLSCVSCAAWNVFPLNLLVRSNTVGIICPKPMVGVGDTPPCHHLPGPGCYGTKKLGYKKRWLGGRIMCISSHHTANMNFIFMSLCVYLFKNFPSQFLSYWESAEPMFFSEELSSLPCKNQNKRLTLSYLVEKFKSCVCWEFYISVSSTGPPLHIMDWGLGNLFFGQNHTKTATV